MVSSRKKKMKGYDTVIKGPDFSWEMGQNRQLYKEHLKEDLRSRSSQVKRVRPSTLTEETA